LQRFLSRLVKLMATIAWRSRWRVNAGLDDSDPFRMAGRFVSGHSGGMHLVAWFLTGDWKVPRTRRQECLRYMAQATFLSPPFPGSTA
jgi:hypothetical protein